MGYADGMKGVPLCFSVAVLDNILKIARVRLSHAGQYKCQAISMSGEVKAITWKVHVKDAIGQ